MAKLTMTVDLDRQKVFELVDGIVTAQRRDVEVKLGHVSENGQHVEIKGLKTDLLQLQMAFEQKNQIVSVFD